MPVDKTSMAVRRSGLRSLKFNIGIDEGKSTVQMIIDDGRVVRRL